MKNKYLHLVALLLVSGGMVWAQPKVAGVPSALVKSGIVKLAPQWSPDGTKLALTSLNHDGIWIADADGKNISQVTADAGTGYKFSWSGDNKTILARTSVRENNRVAHEVKTYNVADKTAQVILAKTRSLKGLPNWNSNNTQISYTLDAQTKSVSSGKIALRNAKEDSAADKLVRQIQQDAAGISSKIAGLNQFKGLVVFNAIASPLKDKIAFQVGGKGLFVCDSDGNNVKNIGNGSRPSWMPDGKYLIVSVTKDDGHVMTGGVLYAVDVNTGDYSQLTDQRIIALSPSVSPNGKKIAFEEYTSGDIYVVNLK